MNQPRVEDIKMAVILSGRPHPDCHSCTHSNGNTVDKSIHCLMPRRDRTETYGICEAYVEVWYWEELCEYRRACE